MAPAHDLVRVGICHQVQVATVSHQVDVRDIAHPKLVRPCRHEASDEVLVPVVAVVRVRRVARLGTPLRQLEVAQQLEECVAARHPVAKEHALGHQPELVLADAWNTKWLRRQNESGTCFYLCFIWFYIYKNLVLHLYKRNSDQY